MWKKMMMSVAAALISGGLAHAQDKATDLAVVVNPACSLEAVSTSELTRIFKAEKAKTADGVKFVIVVRDSDSAEQAAALKGIYGMTGSEYDKYFLQATFAGVIQAAPKQLPTASAMRQFVSTTAGGIGFMRASEADGAVKVVKVDGKAPGESGYPLKIK